MVIADQATKRWALSALDDGPVQVAGPLRLALTFNRSGAFGLGGAIVPFLALGALAVVVVVVVRGAMTQRPALLVCSGLLLGGAIGNLADRMFRGRGLLRGAVVDFVDVGFWPVFNLADAAITVGCLLLVWFGWRQSAPVAATAS